MIQKLILINLQKHQTKRVAKLINNGDIDNFEIKKTSFANHYSHEKTRFVDEPYLHSNKHKNLESILEAFKENK